ncbi:MAG: tetratricopeptide repeat protein [Acidobacteriota bacterium]|nr:tetratricopeptide repeat protein [Acidobacteriota bacterium]
MAKSFRDTDHYSYALYNLGCLYAKTKRTDEASSVLQQALELNPDLVTEFQQDPELELQHAAQQVIGREAETATFLSRCPLILCLHGGSFRPRQLFRR